MPANKKMRSQICKHHFFVATLQQDDYRFRKTDLQELYVRGRANDKKHRFQPAVVTKYVKVINLMKQLENVLSLYKESNQI